jgi:predicted MFS family arabinose efflux permease
VTAFVAEIPAGALADRWSRRGSVVLSSVLEAVGFVVWTALPGLPGFAAGFVLWGLGGALASGAAEALVYEGLVAAGAPDAYPRVNGWISATQLLTQLPCALLASGLYAAGGYPLVGWVSVASCLVTAALALRFPEPPRVPDGDGDAVGMRAGLAAALRRRGMVLLVAALALVGGIDAVEEYFPVMAGEWGVPTTAVPLAVLAIPLAGAAGAALGGRAGRLPARRLGALLVAAAGLLAAAAVWGRSPALGVVALGYGCYMAVLVVAEARLQERITGRYRATITSVAAVGVEVTSLAVFGAWAVHGLAAVAVLVLAAAPVLALALRDRGRAVS